MDRLKINKKTYNNPLKKGVLNTLYQYFYDVDISSNIFYTSNSIYNRIQFELTGEEIENIENHLYPITIYIDGYDDIEIHCTNYIKDDVILDNDMCFILYRSDRINEILS